MADQYTESELKEIFLQQQPQPSGTPAPQYTESELREVFEQQKEYMPDIKQERYQPPLSTGERVRGLMSSFAEGPTFGHAGEISGLMQGVAGEVGDVIGAWEPRPFWDRYAEQRARFEGEQQRFTKENPYAAGSLEFLGSLPISAAMGGVIGIGGKGSSVLGNVGKSALLGGAEGTAYGYGKGGDTQDAWNKAMQAGVAGTVLGGGIPLAISGVGALASSRPAMRTYEAIANALRKSGTAPIKGPRGAAEREVLKAVSYSSPEELIEARARQEAGEKLGKTQIMSELLPGDDIAESYTRQMASRPGAASPMQAASTERVAGVGARITKDIAEESSSESIGAGIRKGTQVAKQKVDDIVKARKAATKPLYDEMEDVVFQGDMIEEVLENADIQKAIRKARNRRPKLKELPDSHFKVLDKAKKILYSEANKAKRAGDPDVAIDFNESRRLLVDAMDSEGPAAYKQARAKYRYFAEEVEELENGPLRFLIDAKDGNEIAAVKKFLTLEGPELDEALKILGPSDRDWETRRGTDLTFGFNFSTLE